MTEATPTEAPVQTDPNSLITEKPASVDFSKGKPEGFPDEFWDAQKNSPKADELFNAFSQQKARADGLRVKLSKGEFEGKPPEDIKEYQLELDEKLKPLVPDDDPIFNAARQAAKDAGLPKEAFAKFMLPVISKLAELKQGQETPPSPEEIAAARAAEVEKLGPSGSKIVDAVASYIKELESTGAFSPSEARYAESMVNSAEAARIFNKLRMRAGGNSQIPVEVPIDEKASRMDIGKKMAEAMSKGDEVEYTKYAAMLRKMN